MKWITGITAAIVVSFAICAGPMITAALCASYEENVSEEIMQEDGQMISPEADPLMNGEEENLVPAEDAPAAGENVHDSGEYSAPDDGAYQESLYYDDQGQYGEDDPSLEPDYFPEGQEDPQWQDDTAGSPAYGDNDQIYMEDPDAPAEESGQPEEGQYQQ